MINDDRFWTDDMGLFEGTFHDHRDKKQPVRGKLHLSKKSAAGTTDTNSYLCRVRPLTSFIYLDKHFKLRLEALARTSRRMIALVVPG